MHYICTLVDFAKGKFSLIDELIHVYISHFSCTVLNNFLGQSHQTCELFSRDLTGDSIPAVLCPGDHSFRLEPGLVSLE